MRTPRAIVLAFALFAPALAASAGEAPQLPPRDISEQFDVMLIEQPIEIDVIGALPLPAATNYAALIGVLVSNPPSFDLPSNDYSLIAQPKRVAGRKVRRRRTGGPHSRQHVHVVIADQRPATPPAMRHSLPKLRHPEIIQEMALFTPRQTSGFTLLLFGLIALALTPRPAAHRATESP